MAADLVINISGEIDDFQKAIEKGEKEIEGFTNATEQISKVAAVAFAALTAEAGLAISAYGNVEAASQRLTAALQQQGLDAANLGARYRETADALEKKTGIDSEAITSGVTLLQGMIGQVEISDDLIKATVNLAAAQKIDLGSAFELVGKAATNGTEVLKRYGLEVTDTGSRSGNLQAIGDKITTMFGGQAEAAVTGIGSLKLLKVAYDDIQKALGQQLEPLFVAIVGDLTTLAKAFAANETLIRFTAAVLAGGAALAGLITVLGATAIALSSATVVAGAFGVTLSVALGPIALVAAGVTALAAALGYMATQSKTASSEVKNMQAQVEEARQLVDRLQKTASSKIPSVWSVQATQDLVAAKERLADLEESLRHLSSAANKGAGVDIDALNAQKEAANKAEAERKDREARERAVRQEHLNLLVLQASNASQEIIKLDQEEGALLTEIADQKNASIRGKLEERLAIVRRQLAEQRDLEIQQGASLGSDVLAQNKEFNALSSQEKQRFLEENKNSLVASIQTESTTRKKAALDRATQQIKDDNTFLENQRKFGTTYAGIYKLMHSDILTGSAQAAGELSALQSSSNSTLKGIGKAAAVANIVIKTAESAMNIYTGFSTIPIIGPILGVAGAAAAVAFGAEQVGQVTAAADGGLLTGGVPGRDSIPLLGMPGELVVPTRNFDEVVNAVAANRSGGSQNGEGGGGSWSIELSLKDNIADFIEAKIIQRQALGTSRIKAV